MSAEQPILGLRSGEPVSLVRDRKDLRFLLNQADQLPRRSTDIDGIRRDLLSAVQAEIPIEFLLETGLADLVWQQIYHPNALSAVYLGVSSRGINPIFFPQAEAIIAIHSQVIEQQVKAEIIDVSVVVEDSLGKRILTVSYDADSKEAQRVFVSIGDNEWPGIPSGSHTDSRREMERQLIEIPTDIDRLLVLGDPLVSQKMVRLTTDVNTRMIVASARLGDQGGMGFGHWSMTRSGYYERLEGDYRVIGRRTDLEETSWAIRYSARLIHINNGE